MYFSSKKSSKNPSKMRSERLKTQCQKRAFFWHRLFRVLASILEGLQPPSWSQIDRLGLPGPSPKPLKIQFFGHMCPRCFPRGSKVAPKESQGGPRGRFSKNFRWIWIPFSVIFGCENWLSQSILQISYVLAEWRRHLKRYFLMYFLSDSHRLKITNALSP